MKSLWDLLWVVNMSDFELEIKLLTFLVEARAMLWDKKGDIFKDRNETKKAWREVCISLKEDFWSTRRYLRRRYKNNVAIFNVLLTVHHAMILGNCPIWRTNSFQCIYLFIVLYMFRACHAHHQEKQIVSIQLLVNVTPCWWLCGLLVG